MGKLRTFFASGVMIGALAATGCGVKGPPLPPVADTPEASDRAEFSGSGSAAAPSTPKPSPTPSPTPKKKRRR